MEVRDQLIALAYLAASILFILCLRGLSSPEQGKRGVYLGELGMLLAVIATLAKKEIISYEWIIGGLLLGSVIGTLISANLPMTKMPERIAFSHAFGGLATALVGITEFHKLRDIAGHVVIATSEVTHVTAEHGLSRLTMGALGFEVFLGSLTFTGSIMAFGKLQGVITGAPVTWKGQNLMNIGAFFGTLGLLAYQVVYLESSPQWMFYTMVGSGLALGVLAVLPIGGADMPVVVSM
ncbi:MAG: NAD(P)(+) transhydrogenase (Re/Si-specific) subunit beta, partial [Deltaproteobacteria bacterium]|nr:NAD(P)(+) transhydrogenase (Re/Si-specific) subunit beta [Deltaproteobacteria bacterium]